MIGRRSDWQLGAGVALIALVLWLCLLFLPKQGACAVVLVAGQEIGRYALDEEQEILIGDENAYNILVVGHRRAWIQEATCSDGLCVRQGMVNRSGQSVICLPNKVTVTIVGGEGPAVDEVAR